MALNLSTKDHEAMDGYIDAVLNAYREGTITLLQARSDLAHVITAAAIDSEDFKNYIRISPKDRWSDFKNAGGA